MSNWKELKNSMSNIDLCKKIIKDYLNHGTFKKLEHLYNVNQMTMFSFLRVYAKEVAADNPALYKQFEDAKKHSIKSQEHKEKTRQGVLKVQQNTLKNFEEKIFDELPKRIRYLDFLDFLLEYKTGELDGKELIRMAKERGIQVIG